MTLSPRAGARDAGSPARWCASAPNQTTGRGEQVGHIHTYGSRDTDVSLTDSSSPTTHREVMIEKHYRGYVPRTCCDTFWAEVQKSSHPSEVCPVFVTPKYYLIHVQVSCPFSPRFCPASPCLFSRSFVPWIMNDHETCLYPNHPLSSLLSSLSPFPFLLFPSPHS